MILTAKIVPLVVGVRTKDISLFNLQSLLLHRVQRLNGIKLILDRILQAPLLYVSTLLQLQNGQMHIITLLRNTKINTMVMSKQVVDEYTEWTKQLQSVEM